MYYKPLAPSAKEEFRKHYSSVSPERIEQAEKAIKMFEEMDKEWEKQFEMLRKIKEKRNIK